MDKRKVDEKLFRQEQEILRAAVAAVEDEKYRGNELLSRYKVLQEQYEKLLHLTQKTFRISDSQGRILHRHQAEIQNLLDNANQGFLTFGPDLKVERQYSAECLRIFNCNIAGVSIVELLTQQGDVDGEAWRDTFEAAFSAPRERAQAVLRQLPSIVKIGDRSIRIECKIISRPVEEGEQELLMLILTDITEKRKAEAEIHYLSYHDKLTSLHNRAYIEKIMLELEQAENAELSVIVIDMNGLKLTNDVFGHAHGDRLLVAMGQVLLKVCRQTDIIARWGGDEFLAILPQTGSSACTRVCQRIREACEQAGNTPVRLSAAIGAATSESGKGIAELFLVAENRMYSDKLAQSREVRINIIADMENRLHDRCFENDGHGERVYACAKKFADFLGADSAQVDDGLLQQLSALHDIGKVAIPREILGKREPLTPDEWEKVKNHSEVGYRMAQSIGEPLLAELVLALHERWDGTGYPGTARGEEIPFLARLFSLVDVYDILTHDRPYGCALTKSEALGEIAAGKASQFDPEMTDRFLDFIKNRE